MTEKSFDIAELIVRYLREELLTDEKAALDIWLNASVENRELFQKLTHKEDLSAELRQYADRDISNVWAKVYPHLKRNQTVDSYSLPSQSRRVSFLHTRWVRYAAAIILISGLVAYLWNTQHKNRALTSVNPISVQNDAFPGSDKAILTLSTGEKVELKAGSAQTITDGQLAISNNNGTLAYEQSKVVVYNTMTTPKGGQYKLTLPDGTKVWLNAASSITYPTAFPGSDRIVKISGEAYFEVAKDNAKPFIVQTPKDEITVLGTEFNVNAYPDELAVKTSLIEGSVKIANAMLKPGEAYENGNIIKTDIQQDIAWKNGTFNFNNLSVEEAMRQLARWYDISIKYDNGVPKEELFGEIGRNLKLQEVLEGLEGEVAHFRLEQKTLHVTPVQ